MRQSSPLSIGLAVHNDAMAVASVAQVHGAEVIDLGAIGTRQCDIAHRIRKMPAQATQLRLGAAAGPWGAWLDRDGTNTGDACWVVAPSRVPQKAGDRGKPDRRDARHLARLARSGALPVVAVPTGDDDALRDLPRAREETRRALQDAQLRRNAFCLRHASRSTGQAKWRPAPLRGLSAVGCPTPAPPSGLPDDVRAGNAHPARRPPLAQARQAHVQSWRWPPVVAPLQAVRGGQCPVAVTLGAAVGDRSRCETPSARLHCLGVLPAASSSGERRPQGSMTNAGNSHARRALGEGAWAYREPAKVSRHRQRRLATPPKGIQDSSGKAQGRRCPRDRRRGAKGNHAHGVTVALAREWGGFRWALATAVPVTP